MKEVRIIQFGDVHLPDGGEIVDLKDRTFPEHLVHLIVPDTIQQSLRKVLKLIDEDPLIQGIFFTGDFTSRGDLEAYDKCVHLILDAIRTSVPRIFKPQLLHAVPGNHDIDRSICGISGKELYEKFEPLTAVWDSLGMSILATSKVRETEIPGIDGGRLNVFSINSCYGCGEKRSLPEPVREQMYDVLTSYASQSYSEAFDIIGEQLDTPAFLNDDINYVTERLRALPNPSSPKF